MDEEILITLYSTVVRRYSFLLFEYKTYKKLYGNKAYYYMKYDTLIKTIKEQLNHSKQEFANYERLYK